MGSHHNPRAGGVNGNRRECQARFVQGAARDRKRAGRVTWPRTWPRKKCGHVTRAAKSPQNTADPAPKPSHVATWPTFSGPCRSTLSHFVLSRRFLRQCQARTIRERSSLSRLPCLQPLPHTLCRRTKRPRPSYALLRVAHTELTSNLFREGSLSGLPSLPPPGFAWRKDTFSLVTNLLHNPTLDKPVASPASPGTEVGDEKSARSSERCFRTPVARKVKVIRGRVSAAGARVALDRSLRLNLPSVTPPLPAGSGLRILPSQ
jgi:hypothetical protein